MDLASAGIFVLRYPDHPITASIRQLADALVVRDRGPITA
jgi:MinD-like ATPase involved in chromosome partitioning or flagellar assembly